MSNSYLSDYLEKRAKASNAERMLLTEDGLSIAVTAGLGYAYFNELNEKELLSSWEAEFGDSFNQKMNAFTERRFSDLREYENLFTEPNPDAILESYGHLTDSAIAHNLARALRNDDVRAKWEFEQFFALEGGEGAKRVLDYYSYEDGVSAYETYSREQFNELLETGRVSEELEILHGHHINDVSGNAFRLDRIEELFHVNNIRLMTRGAHHEDPGLDEGGLWQNGTSGDSNEVLSIVEEIIDAQKIISGEKIVRFDAKTGISVGLAVGTISAFLEMRKFKNDPRPWKKKALLISVSTFVKGFEAGTLALIALKTRTAIASLSETESFQSAVEAANQILTEAFPGGLISTMDADSLASAAAFSVSIAELRIIRAGIVAVGQWRQSNFRYAFRQMSKDSVIIITEESVFLGSAVLFNMFYEAGEDAFVADPTGGFIIVVRLGWSLGKKGYQYNANKKTMSVCRQKKMDGLYETALASMVDIG
ncbi:MAG: hypothetical protein LAT67_11415 [Balneolales bacterium]|nr:hypothetical protein [Balneolales bacterium]